MKFNPYGITKGKVSFNNWIIIKPFRADDFVWNHHGGHLIDGQILAECTTHGYFNLHRYGVYYNAYAFNASVVIHLAQISRSFRFENREFKNKISTLKYHSSFLSW